jgi:hypothetical protein
MTIDPYDEIEFAVEKPKRKKKGVNGKAKGNAYEREICKKISKLLTLGAEDYAVWRSASSGAVATNIGKKSKTKESFLKSQSGDIAQVIPKGQYEKLDEFFDKFFVETKFYKDLSLYPPYTKELKTFVAQLLGEKETSGKDIIFIFKANNKSDIVFTDHNFSNNTNLYNCLQMTIYISGKALDIYLFKDFISYY